METRKGLGSLRIDRQCPRSTIYESHSARIDAIVGWMPVGGTWALLQERKLASASCTSSGRLRLLAMVPTVLDLAAFRFASGTAFDQDRTRKGPRCGTETLLRTSGAAALRPILDDGE